MKDGKKYRDENSLDAETIWAQITNEEVDLEKNSSEIYYPIKVDLFAKFREPIEPNEIDYITIDGHRVDFE